MGYYQQPPMWNPQGPMYVQQPRPPRSFIGSAFIVLILYIFFWIVGLVLNIVYLREAKMEQYATGYPPEGKGCLIALLWIMGIIPVILSILGIIVWVILMIIAANTN